MKRFCFPLAVALCLLALVTQPATVSAKDTWISIRTRNFYLIGNANASDIRKVALKLEQFREAFTQLFPSMKFNTPVPVTVVAFKNQSSYAPFGAPNSGGYFQAGPDVNYIALSTDWYLRGDAGLFRIIFHEYTHLLVNNTLRNPPLWFNEGLAEYYSTFRISDDQKFEIGIEPGNHLSFLRKNGLLPLRTLFAVDHKSPHYNERSKKSVFYAQSWALMHYLIVGKPGQTEKLTRFLDMLAANVPVETAFPKAFDTTFEAMQKELRDYVSKDRYPTLSGQFSTKLGLDALTEAKPLTEAESQAYLGDLLLRSNSKDAGPYLEKALQLDPNLVMAHASLGMLRFREGKPEEARASLERAIAANSQNYLTHYYYAVTLMPHSREESMANYTPEQIAKIRLHVKRAIELRPDFPESYTLLGFISLVTGTEIDESIGSIKRILRDVPGRNDLNFLLAQLYYRKKDYATARPMLEQIAKSDSDSKQSAQGLLNQLDLKSQADQGDPNSTPSDVPKASLPAGPVVVVGDTTVVQPDDPSARLREVLRKPAAGETQIMATLVKIECERKNIDFHFQTPTGQLRLRTNSFDDIQITTFTAEVKGDIGCGPRKPQNVVVICYLPNTDKRIKANGILKSVEFVPADFKLKP